MDWKMRRGQIKHLLYEHCLNGRIDKHLLIEQFNDLNNVEPIKHGRWKTVRAYPNVIMCSECNTPYERREFVAIPNYCPNCGARMDEVEE